MSFSGTVSPTAMTQDQISEQQHKQRRKKAEEAVEGIGKIPERRLTDEEMSKLADVVIAYCQQMTGINLFPYEEEFGWRVVYSLLIEDADEITALFARQSGKCLAPGTPVMMFDGTSNVVEDIRVGDLLMGDDSTPRTVQSLARGRERMWRVQPRSKGHESYTVNESHILTGTTRYGNRLIDRPLKELLDLKDIDSVFLGTKIPVEFPARAVPTDPYWFGLWLGDGSSYDVGITTADHEVVAYLEDYASRLGLKVSIYPEKNASDTYAITNGNVGGGNAGIKNPLRDAIRDLGVYANKHIPNLFLANSQEVRLQLLAGIIDSDGHRPDAVAGKENTCEVTFKSSRLARDLQQLARSLGYRAAFGVKPVNGVDYHRIRIYGPLWDIPTRILRKQYPVGDLRENPRTYGFDLVDEGVGDYYGFEIDGNKRFLLGDCTVTHNTETVAVLVTGCMVMLPILGNVLEHDDRLAKFKDGLWCGIYAPNYEQAGIMWSRMKLRMYSKAAKQALLDPDIDIDLMNRSENMTLPNGSFCDCGTASPQATIEGKTYHLILLEECLGPDSVVGTPEGHFRIQHLVRSGYAGRVRAWDHDRGCETWAVVEGRLERPAVHECYELEFEDGTVQRATLEHPWFIDGAGYIRTQQLFERVQSSSYNTIIHTKSEVHDGPDDSGVPVGRRVLDLPGQEVQQDSTVRGEPLWEAAGVCEPEVGAAVEVWMQGCSGEAEPGQGVYLGEGRVRLPSGASALLRPALHREGEASHEGVPGSPERGGPRLVVDGRRPPVESQEPGSAVHERFHRRGSGCDGRVVLGEVGSHGDSGDREEVTDSTASVSGSRGGTAIRNNAGLRVRLHELQADRPEAIGMRHLWRVVHPVQDDVEEPLLFLGVSEGAQAPVRLISIRQIDPLPAVYDLKTSESNFFASGILSHNTQDISDDKLRSSIHPMAAATAGTLVKIGTCNRRRSEFYSATRRNKRADVASGRLRSRTRNHFEYDYTHAQRYNPRYRKYVAKERTRLGEDSDDFRMKYKLHWLLERGMFVNPDLFDECGITDSNSALKVVKGKGKRKRVIKFSRPPNVVTYDIMTTDLVFAIDVGRAKNSTVVTVAKVFWDNPIDFGDETRYPVHIYNWLEIFGDDHEAQHVQIVAFLKNYRVSQGIVDATGKGDPVYSRLAAELAVFGIDVHPFLFTAQSKDIGYKVLLQEFQTRRMTFPAGAKATRLRKWQAFCNQMYDLEKDWRGSTMVVNAPKGEDAHDDYPDSLMMLSFLVNVRGTMEVEVAANPFVGRVAKWAAADMMRQAGAWYRNVTDPRSRMGRGGRESKRGRFD